MQKLTDYKRTQAKKTRFAIPKPLKWFGTWVKQIVKMALALWFGP
jgi:hypothetical protein